MNPTNSPPPEPTSTTRFGTYTILGELGRGGMGSVFRAHDAHQRPVALKLLRSSQITSQALLRFQREGQVTARLRHVGIVRVHEAGVLDGRAYLAYALVEGGRTLKDVLQTSERALAVELIAQAAEALGHAHSHGVIHRDIKASNILVAPDDRALVADFGVAQAVGLERLTQSGALIGTPRTMAPEQITTDRAALSPATDVWALGVLLYRALTGSPPFVASSLMELAAQITSEDPPRPRSVNPEVSRQLEAVCWRALRKPPSHRHADGAEFAADLRAALAGRRRSPTVRPLGLALGSVVLGGVVLGAALASSPAPTPPEPSASPRTPAPPSESLVRLNRALEVLAEDVPRGVFALRQLPAPPPDPSYGARLRAAQQRWSEEVLAELSAETASAERWLPLLERLGVLAEVSPEAPPCPQAGAIANRLITRVFAADVAPHQAAETLQALTVVGARVTDQRAGIEALRLYCLGYTQSEQAPGTEGRGLLRDFARLDVGFRNGISLLDMNYLGNVQGPPGADPWSRYTRLRIRCGQGFPSPNAFAELAALSDDPDLTLGPVHRGEVLALLALSEAEAPARLRFLDRAQSSDPDSPAVRWLRARTLQDMGRSEEGLLALEHAHRVFLSEGGAQSIYTDWQEHGLVLAMAEFAAELDRRDEARAKLSAWRALLQNPSAAAPPELLSRFPWLDR